MDANFFKMNLFVQVFEKNLLIILEILSKKEKYIELSFFFFFLKSRIKYF